MELDTEVCHFHLGKSQDVQQLVKLYAQDFCHLKQHLVRMNAQTASSWQLPLHDLTLMVSDGYGILHYRNQVLELKPGLFVSIPAFIPHKIYAEDDLTFLMTIIISVNSEIQADLSFCPSFLSTMAYTN
jgi:mannose-6-phosphate isomerase-like protein (cupin superfamily)